MVERLERTLLARLEEDTEEKLESWQVTLYMVTGRQRPHLVSRVAGVKAGLASAKTACVEHAGLCSREISREKVNISPVFSRGMKCIPAGQGDGEAVW